MNQYAQSHCAQRRLFQRLVGASLFFALLFALASPSIAVTPAILIGPDLKPRTVNLQAFGTSKLTYFDAERRLQIEPTGDLLQIRFPIRPADAANTKSNLAKPAKTLAILNLNDGQRLVGQWIGADESGENLTFKHEVLGTIQINLDLVRSLSLSGVTVEPATPNSDELTLANSDVIRGFVVGFSAKSIEVQPTGSKQSIQLPIARVGSVRLANPLTVPKERSHIVWLRDGSRLRTKEIDLSSDQANMTPTLLKKETAIALKQIARIELASLAGRLVDLIDLPLEVSSGGKVFGLSMLPRKSDGMLLLHAPVTARFKLPARATRFAAVAELAIGSGNDARWADFIVQFRTDDQTANRVRINSKTPIHAINVELDGRYLNIQLDSAGNGPVLDRLRLRESMIFIEADNP